MRRVSAAFAALVVAVALGGCTSEDGGGAGGEGRLSVVAGFYPVAAAVQAVGGDGVEVHNLTPVGAEPHDLELTPDQVDRLEDADLVVFLGGGFQPAVEDVAERRAGAALDLLAGVEGDDPHLWLDPVRFAESSESIEQALAELEPASAAVFATNGRAFRDRMADLDTEFRDGLSGCARRDVVTSHSAFAYLAERYGLTEHAIAGLSPEAEPDAGRLSQLTSLIRDKGVTTVFYESLVSPRVAETLAREAGVQTAVLNPLEGLTEEEREAGEDYESVMRTNLAALRAALGCP